MKATKFLIKFHTGPDLADSFEKARSGLAFSLKLATTSF